ncbi:hypothetical protein JTE90_022166 [Oedothorax gibbosus]|uniref:RRM domain-containing protein n=1 Tax=Oedothorax gibbosus TaxID=931172 RepID=A0AAV6VQP9_9ARAC|nr:hypothetical protein JTE90_022166 [Oedothorax gibbosus]
MIYGWDALLMMNNVMVRPRVTKTFPNCTLVPPPPAAPAPTRRPRPNGCKTVFVGLLPEKITEEIIKEVFSDCGEISAVKMSEKNNYCHIRFASEDMVDSAMYFSGYRLKIENKDDPAYNSRIHVDYGISRDDQLEYECRRRNLSWEE